MGRWVFFSWLLRVFLTCIYFFFYVGELVLYVLLAVECVICSMYVGGM